MIGRDPANIAEWFDLNDPAQHHDPYPIYALARRLRPVFYSRRVGQWIVSRHADAVAILTDDTRFSVVEGGDGALAGPGHVRRISEDWLRAAIRRALSPAGTAHSAAHGGHAGRIAEAGMGLPVWGDAVREEVARALVVCGTSSGPVDLVAAVARPLPMQVFCRVLGLETRYVDALQAVNDGWPETDEAAFAGAREVWQGLIRDRTQRPANDIVSYLVQASRGRSGASEALVNACLVLQLSATENMSNLIGLALLRALSDPSAWRCIRGDLAYRAELVEKVLRQDCPVQSLLRETRCPVTVGGQVIGGGERVSVLFASANREISEAADEGSIPGRHKHIGFGLGRHRCLGEHLARMLAATVLGMLAAARHAPRLVDADEIRFDGAPNFRGPSALWIEGTSNLG